MIDTIFNYFGNSSAITIFVFALLSIYLILIFWIFLQRYFAVSEMITNEQNSLNSLTSGGASLGSLSALTKCTNNITNSKPILHACEISIIRDASKGISWLSIISSTSPFIGLFGTVIGILESFAMFSTQSKVAFSVIAPAISEALVATAAGIFVAVFAYTFHQIMVRRVYELNIYLKAQCEILIAKG